MVIKEKLQQIKSGKLSATDNIKHFLDIIKKKNKDINAFLYIAEKEALEQAKKVDAKKTKGKLAGLAIAVKANINVIDMPISCASKTLENYKGTYDADVIERIKQTIPSGLREWNPDKKEWWVSECCEKQINDIFRGFLEAIVAQRRLF